MPDDPVKEACGPFLLPAPPTEGREPPSLAMLRGVWTAFQEENASADQVLRVIDQVTEIINFELRTLDEQAEKGLSDPENPTFQQIVAAFELHLEALNVMAEDDGRGQLFLEGFVLARRATDQLAEAHRQTMEHIAAMGQVACIFCGHSNARESERCSQCGRVQPGGGQTSSFSAVNQEGLESAGPGEASPQVTENFVRVAQSVAAFRAGELDEEGLLEQLESVESKLAAHLEETAQHETQAQQAPASARSALLEAVAQTQAALEQSLAALDKMKLAFQKGDDSYLQLGLDDLEAGSKELVQAFHASRAAAQLTKAAAPTGSLD